MIACVPASMTAHRMLADFGIENVMSNPAIAFVRLPISGWAYVRNREPSCSPVTGC